MKIGATVDREMSRKIRDKANGIFGRWDIAVCGLDTFQREVTAITRGREDLVVEAVHPGKLMLIQKRAI